MRLNCPVCGDTRSHLIDQRQAVPILMHNTFSDTASARACKTGRLSVRRCDACGFAWNAAFEPEKIVYGPGYDNAQGHSAHFQRHLDERVDAILAAFPGDRLLNVIEVGAGQGEFLNRIAGRAKGRLPRAVGFDPAWRGMDGERIAADGVSDIRMYRRVFDGMAAALAADVGADLVISRHVIEHIAEPLAFLRAIRAGIIDRPATRLFLETPDIDWILRNQAFEDFFYEHCSIFNPRSMQAALMGAGFGDVAVETVFGGQYLWATARFDSDVGENRKMSESMPNAGSDFSTDALAGDWRSRIRSWRSDGGKVAVWGAGAKGMTFAQIVDPAGTEICAIIDVNPGKHGRYIGVSAHRIMDPQDVRALAPSHIIIMNPNYAAEIRTMLAADNIHASLLTLHEDLT